MNTCAARRFVLAAIASGIHSMGSAQVYPDAGRVLREQMPAPVAPERRESLTIEPQRSDAVAPGGARVKLEHLKFEGNTVFSDEQLNTAAGDVFGKDFDLAALQEIADRVADFYRDRGFPFARVVVPPQTVGSGHLKLDIIEGRYGAVTAVGDEQLAPHAQQWLAPLKAGAVIREEALERATLLLSDQPGVSTRPLIRPGGNVGTGDLEVAVRRDITQAADVGIDNHGSRYTGYQRARGSWVLNSPTMLGDQLMFTAVQSDGHLTLGNLNYSRPLGYDGLRLQSGMGYTTYRVGRELALAHRGGDAQVYNLGLTYPFVRSNQVNLTGGVVLNYKNLHDYSKDFTCGCSVYADKSVTSLPVSMQFDVRDNFFGPAISFGSVALTVGNLRFGASSTDSTARQSVQAGKTLGDYAKLNLDAVRQQYAGDYLLSARFSGQYTRKNLDSSEDFLLGGPSGVRAYPVGEASGDRGFLYQIEVRRQFGPLTPYVFYDGGRVQVQASPTSADGYVSEQRQGGGVGIRYVRDRLSVDGIAARRASGGAPKSDAYANAVQLWLTMNYRF
jgi:hemolysin activation/secretion protein